MAEPTDPTDDSDRSERKQRAPRPRRRREPSKNRDRERHEKEGDDPRAHAEILERRWLGSAPPTPKLYATALGQWRALPGAVMSPATSVTIPSAPAASRSQRADTIGGQS